MASYDLIIRNGTIVDGSGEKGYKGDVAISGDSIAAVGDLGEARAAGEIDAEGNVVAPGFIDMHSHSDYFSIICPQGASKIYSGVTTEVIGNCGMSAFPLKGLSKELVQKDFEPYGLEIDWETIEGYKARAESTGYSLNRVMLAGHGAIRASVMGHDNRAPTAEELAKMKGELRKALEAGAFGLSTGLIYLPGCYSKTDELIELCKLVKEYEGIYASHLRSESTDLLAAVQEIIDIQRGSGVRVHIAHLKVWGQENWYKFPGLKMMLFDAIEKGVDVTGDRYPYVASSTSLDKILPDWIYEGGAADEVRRIKDRATRSRIIKEVKAQVQDEDYWQTIMIAYVASEKNKYLEGMRLSDVAKELGGDPLEVALDLIAEEECRVSAIYFCMSEDSLRQVLSWPFVMIGSDAGARCKEGPASLGKPHPRAYGTAARLLGAYVREAKVLTLEQAIWKLAGFPAERLALKKRGRLAPGNFADITVFDPDTIIDRATFGDPHQYSTGVNYVLVNGKLVIEEGKHLGTLPGRILTSRTS